MGARHAHRRSCKKHKTGASEGTPRSTTAGGSVLSAPSSDPPEDVMPDLFLEIFDFMQSPNELTINIFPLKACGCEQCIGANSAQSTGLCHESRAEKISIVAAAQKLLTTHEIHGVVLGVQPCNQCTNHYKLLGVCWGAQKGFTLHSRILLVVLQEKLGVSHLCLAWRASFHGATLDDIRSAGSGSEEI
eukprot:2407542-Amphidinium_carterae.3